MKNASEETVRGAIGTRLCMKVDTQVRTSEIFNILTDQSRDAWDPANFSDPLEPRSLRANYRYIIHAMKPTTVRVTKPTEIAYLEEHYPGYVARDTINVNALTFRITELYLGDPGVICSEVLSCSLIGQGKSATYQNMCSGFVLSVPKSNFCQVGAVDLVAASVQNTARSSSLSKNEFTRKIELFDFWDQLAGKSRRNLLTPDAVLRDTSAHGHNELIVVGTFLSQVRASAIFVKVTSQGKVWADLLDVKVYDLGALIAACVRKRRIPPNSDLALFHNAFKKLALTHHPDRTKDEDKRQKFVDAVDLLDFLKKAKSSPTGQIEWHQ